MSFKIPRNNEQEWRDLLMNVPKEKLVEILIGKIVRDPYFHHEMEIEFIQTDTSIDEMIQEFANNITDEKQFGYPSTNYLQILGYNLLEKAENMERLLDQIKLCIAVIKSMDDAINDGAGYQEDNDFILTDLMEDSWKQMLQNIDEKFMSTSKEEQEEIFNIMNQDYEYNFVDHKKMVLEKLKEKGMA